MAVAVLKAKCCIMTHKEARVTMGGPESCACVQEREREGGESCIID